MKVILIVKNYLFIILCLYFSPLNAWELLSDFPGSDRLNPKILSMDGKIFIFGGQNNIYPNSPIYDVWVYHCLLYTSPSPRDKRQSRMPSSA